MDATRTRTSDDSNARGDATPAPAPASATGATAATTTTTFDPATTVAATFSGPTTPTGLTTTTTTTTTALPTTFPAPEPPSLSPSLSSPSPSLSRSPSTTAVPLLVLDPPPLEQRRPTNSVSAAALFALPPLPRPASSPRASSFSRLQLGSSTPTTPTGSSDPTFTAALHRTRSSLVSLTSMGAGKLHRIKDKFSRKKRTSSSGDSGRERGDARSASAGYTLSLGSTDSGSCLASETTLVGQSGHPGTPSRASTSSDRGTALLAAPTPTPTPTPTHAPERDDHHNLVRADNRTEGDPDQNREPAHLPRGDVEPRASDSGSPSPPQRPKMSGDSHPLSSGAQTTARTTIGSAPLSPPPSSSMAATGALADLKSGGNLVRIDENEVFQLPDTHATTDSSNEVISEGASEAPEASETSEAAKEAVASASSDSRAWASATRTPPFYLSDSDSSSSTDTLRAYRRALRDDDDDDDDDDDEEEEAVLDANRRAGSLGPPTPPTGHPITPANSRKIWVKRPGASATMVVISDHDLVDDVRDCILRKYSNSLGRYYDSPDVSLRILVRDSYEDSRRHPLYDRDLGPEEIVGAVLDKYYPGGQLVTDAILIDIPTARATPRLSPSVTSVSHPIHPTIYYTSPAHNRPSEAGETYFPHMGDAGPTATAGVQSRSYRHQQKHPPHSWNQLTHHPQYQQQHHYSYHHNSHRHYNQQYHHHGHPHSYAYSHLPRAVTPTGGVPPSATGLFGSVQPPFPSPGASGSSGSRMSRTYRDRPERPRLGRTHTPSPGIMGLSSMTAASHPPIATVRHPDFGGAVLLAGGVPVVATNLGMLSIAEVGAGLDARLLGDELPLIAVGTPPPVQMSPRASNPRKSSKRPKKRMVINGFALPPAGNFEGGVPPINVLIVEDNPINLKLLEAFVRKLGVRWRTATNGKDAIAKWRQGGYHLVLMDIQLPVMNGLDATREIRRLEKMNCIGMPSPLSPTPFSSKTQNVIPVPLDGISDEDRLIHQDKDRLDGIDLFKSPVIIVALTASSLQSDRHEALAAGCNDFLTKPVNFDWLERKVTEWGCMQALIDFEGWRKWKEFSAQEDANARLLALTAKQAAKSKKKMKL